MILDIHAYIGKWPYWPVANSTPSQLIAELNRWGIGHAAACSLRSLFVHWEDGNRETEEAAANSEGRLLGFACLGPSELSPSFVHQEFDLAQYRKRGFRGVRLYPQHHTYHPLFVPFIDQICEEAAASKWPVLLPHRVIMNWGVPMLNLETMARLVERHPRVPWILGGINYFEELQVAVHLMKQYPSVHLETSCVQGFNAIATVVEKCGPAKLLFGSGAPLQHLGAGLKKVLQAPISDSEREAILGGNACRLLDLNPK